MTRDQKTPTGAPCGLPRIDDLLEPVAPRTDYRSRQQWVTETLRHLAESVRRPVARPFYSIPHCAAALQVGRTQVARAFARLQDEGLLLRIRGSHTEVTPRRPGTRRSNRGIVLIPVWAGGFVMYEDWRVLLINLERELAARRFVADLFFYVDELTDRAMDRVMARSPDALFWFCPNLANYRTVLSLRDRGVRTSILTDTPEVVPGRFHMDHEPGVRQALTAWRRAGVTVVEIEAPATDRHRVWFERLADQVGLGTLPGAVTDGQESTTDHVAALGRAPGTGVVFLDDAWHNSLCHTAPRALAELMARCRVLALRTVYPGTMREAPAARLDLAGIDWRAVARRIADDFARGVALQDSPPVTFESVYRPRLTYADIEATMVLTD